MATTRTSRTSRSGPMAARAAAVALGLVLALSACRSSNPTGTNGFVSGDGAALQVADAKRGEPVDLEGTTLDGATLDIASLRGKTVVLNVWGSWCAPCRKEAPALVAANRELAGQNVAFVGINTRDDYPAQAKSFEQTYGITYPSLVDEGGELLLALRGAVPPAAIPSTLVLDPKGRIAARFNGAISQQTLIDLITDASKP